MLRVHKHGETQSLTHRQAEELPLEVSGKNTPGLHKIFEAPFQTESPP